MLVVALLASAGAESRADSVRLIPDGKDAWQKRVEMIRAARSSIDVAVFIWRDDPTGLDIAGLLQEATTSGVRVRIIADGLARSLPSRVTAALAGTELLYIHDYHPLLVHRLDWLNCRLHDKLLIDGAMGTLYSEERGDRRGVFGIAASRMEFARELFDVIRSQSCGSNLLTYDEPFLTRVGKPSLMVRAKMAFLPMLELFSPLIRSFL